MNLLTQRKEKRSKKEKKKIAAKTKYLSVNRCALKYFVLLQR